MKRVALLISSCALISACINLEEAHDRCFESGRCGAVLPPDAGDVDAGHDAGTPDSGIDAGEVDSGIHDAGHDAGFPEDSGTPDSGMDDAGFDAGPPIPYDGGTRCDMSPNPRLRCSAPLQLGTGSSINYGALMPLPNGFLVGWTGTTFELREVSFDGGSATLYSQTGIDTGQVVLATNGARWAATWMSESATSANCLTSDNPAAPSQVVLQNGRPLNVVGIAISPSGAVAVSAGSTSGDFMGGHAATGCPASIPELTASGYTNGAAVVWTTNPRGDGFRYVNTSEFNGYRGWIEVGAIEDAGYVNHSYSEMNGGPGQSSVVASTNGSTVLTAYSQLMTTDDAVVQLYGTSADLSGDGNPISVNSMIDVGWWSAGTCGPGCAAVSYLSYDTVSHTPVAFYSDDSSTSLRGRYDALCDVAATQSSRATVSIAYSGGRLGMLVTRPARVDLYLCDVPPLP